MRSGKTLLFALAVLFLCSLFATMMSTHHVAEGFAPGDPTTAALTPAQLATLQQANSTAATPMTPIQMAKMQQNQANIQAVPPGVQPAFPPEFLAKNNITDPIGSPLNPSNDQMRVVTEFYNNNPTKKPPASLSLRDQLMFNVSVLPLDQLTAFKNLGQVAATNANMANNSLVMMNAPPMPPMGGSMPVPPMGGSMPMPSMGGPMQMPVEVAPDAPTTSWSRNGVQIVTNVPQKCTPFVQQTMEADGNYFGARVPAGIPQNAMSFPPASYSYVGPPQTSFVPESATFAPTPIPMPIQPAATKPPPLTIAQQPFVPSSTPITR
jgi:hypothetical protein